VIRHLKWLEEAKNKTPIPGELTKPTDGSEIHNVGFVGDLGMGVLKFELPAPKGALEPLLAEPTKPTFAPDWINPQLRNALARELWDEGGRTKTWLIDTSVKAKVALLEQVPSGVAPEEWATAVMTLSAPLTAASRLVGRAYDAQPTITLDVQRSENTLTYPTDKTDICHPDTAEAEEER
jgi:hypothetical protein